MDITGCLPLGTISPRPGEELPVLWEQMDARRTPLGQDPATVPVTGTATLYFPLAEGSGIVAETRALLAGEGVGQDYPAGRLRLTQRWVVRHSGLIRTLGGDGRPAAFTAERLTVF